MKIRALLLGLMLLVGSTAALAADPSPRIMELQEGLTELGYDPGPADGFMGPKTRDAIIAFQKDHDSLVDGKYSGILLFEVNTEVSRAMREATPEGQKEKKERDRLLAMSNEELINLIEGANKEESKKIISLLGERTLELPVGLIFKVTGISTEVMDILITQVLSSPLTKSALDVRGLV